LKVLIPASRGDLTPSSGLPTQAETAAAFDSSATEALPKSRLRMLCNHRLSTLVRSAGGG
jgi:hypothetical protein